MSYYSIFKRRKTNETEVVGTSSTDKSFTVSNAINEISENNFNNDTEITDKVKSSTETTILNNTEIDLNSTIDILNLHDIGLYIDKKPPNDFELINLLKNVWKPDSLYKFQPVKSKNGNRYFNCKWLTEFNWLAYSNIKNGGFCKFCVLFANRERQNNKLGTFVQSPFQQYQKGREMLRQHEECDYHKFAKEKAKTFEQTVTDGQNVADQLAHVAVETKENNRYLLKAIAETIILCGRQNLSLRGHRDSGKIEEESIINDGNFRALLRHRAMVCNDERLKKLLDNCSKNATYLSPSIQNQLIDICAKIFQKNIIERANKSECFAVLADEATDVSMSEILSVSIRFVENVKAYEYFIGFVHLTDLTGDSIAKAIIDFLKTSGLNLAYLRGQGYDGAASMAGKIRGVQAQIKQLYPAAFYVHCAAHTLNLVLCKASLQTDISFAMSTMKDIIIFITYSPKKIELLKKMINEDQRLSSTGRNQLLRLCVTRWVEKHRSVQRFAELLIPVFKTLEKIVESGGIDGNKARSFVVTLMRFDFLFSLFLLRELATDLAAVSRNLQQVNVDLLECLKRIENLKQNFKNLETDERIFDKIYTEAQLRMWDICGSVAMPFDPEIGTARQFYHKTIYLPYLQGLQTQINERFNEQSSVVFKLQKLIPHYFDNDLAPLKECYKFFAEHDLNCSESEFLSEYRSWRQQFHGETTAVCNALDALAKCNKEFDPNIYKLLKVLSTLPATTATAERSFSTMRRLKTYLRNIMSDERMTGLALLNVHREISIDSNEVLDLFKLKDRRIDL